MYLFLKALACLVVFGEILVIAMFFQSMYFLVKRLITKEKNYWYVELILMALFHIVLRVIATFILKA